jgi:hypothetical protein
MTSYTNSTIINNNRFHNEQYSSPRRSIDWASLLDDDDDLIIRREQREQRDWASYLDDDDDDLIIERFLKDFETIVLVLKKSNEIFEKNEDYLKNGFIECDICANNITTNYQFRALGCGHGCCSVCIKNINKCHMCRKKIVR